MRKNAANAELIIDANPDSPLMNACLVIKNWGETSPKVAVNGKLLTAGKDYRIGHNRYLKGTDLVIWISRESNQPVKISINYSTD